MKKFLTISALAVLLASVGGPVVLAGDSTDFASAGIPIVQIPFTFTGDGTLDTGMVTTVSAVIGGTTDDNAGSAGVGTTITGIGRGGFTETAVTQFSRPGNRAVWQDCTHKVSAESWTLPWKIVSSTDRLSF